MTVDFTALQEAVDRARQEAEEATAAKDALTAVNEQLTAIQQSVSDAIATYDRENQERVDALQNIINIVSAGLGE
jgi:hypothetical protein